MPDERVFSRLRTLVHEFPADLAFIVFVTPLMGLVGLIPVIRETPLRFFIALGFVLFAPGYALVSTLFPQTDESRTESNNRTARLFRRGSDIDAMERFALSIGLSVAIVSLIGYALTFTPWGIRFVPLLVAVGSFTILFAVVGAVRRWRLPPNERFSVPYRSGLDSLRSAFFSPETRLDWLLNLLIVASLLLAFGSVGYAITTPRSGERFSELYLLNESANGTLVAGNYPEKFVRGESRPIVVGIDNREHRRINYTIVVEVQRVSVENGATTVLEEQELSRFHKSLPHGATWRTTYNVTPTLVGRELKLVFLLYRGTAPFDSTVDNAYLETHLWINVTRS